MATVIFGDFEWDDTKAATNARKHGVTFLEATDVFDDPRAIDAPDLYNEGRFVIIGLSSQERVLFVVFAERVDRRLRIISARRASKTQRKTYEKNR